MAARAAPSEQRYGAGESLLDLEEGVFEAEAEAPAAQRTLTAERVRVILEPMAGQRLDEDHLMLYRTVLVGERGYRQGLLLDEQALGRWLQREVIGGGKLAGGVALRFGPDAGGVPAPGGYFVSNHAFAEPFDGLRARLAVAPLRGMGSTFTIYALAGLLALVALAGLAAVYRMVSVVVQFAERRSNFVSAVSHELKTPLTAIRMYGEMLRDGLVSSEEKRDEYYRTISDESERLSRLIDNVLEFSRLEKGSREFNLSVGSLGDVVADVCARLQPHVEREGFALRVEVEGELPPVRFDRDALVQMLFNLVDNAMKYASGAGQREIVVRCARGQGGRVALSVRDFGPGVPRQHLTRIFEPFFRGEAELTRSARGSGIGLALVKQLAESMDAIVSGGNAEGGGFRVSIAFEAG